MSIVNSFVKWLYHGDNNNMGPISWATLARFETHQGSLCPPSKCREARTGFDAVILLSQEKVVFDGQARSQDPRGGAIGKLSRGRAFLGQVLPMFWGGAALVFWGTGRASVKNLTGRPRPGQTRFFWAGTGRASPDSLSYLTKIGLRNTPSLVSSP